MLNNEKTNSHINTVILNSNVLITVIRAAISWLEQQNKDVKSLLTDQMITFT